MSGRQFHVWPLVLMLFGCSAVVGDYEATECDPAEPAACSDLGDEDEQRVGCCTADGRVYYCQDGQLHHIDCSETQVCDYNTEAEAMGCVD
jgi:hypothetical protein